MVFSRGDLQAHGIWVCFWVSVFVPRVLEAVGRKDLRNAAPVRDTGAGADSALGTATSGFRPIAVRFRPQLHEARHKLLPAVLPSDLRLSLRCSPKPLCGPRVHSRFLPGAVRAPVADGHSVDFVLPP
jgi:hypothetical protein